MSRSSKATKAALVATTAPEVDLRPTFDRWRKARTSHAFSIIGYTPVEKLFEDFQIWSHEATGLVIEDQAAFEACFENAPRPEIRIEPLQCRAYYNTPKIMPCASLTLLDPIKVAA